MNRKQIAASLLLVLFSVTALWAIEAVYTVDNGGNIVMPASCTDQSTWVSAGTFLAAGAEPTTPNQANRTYALFAAVSKVQIYTVPPKWNSVLLRAGTTTDADSTVFDVFVTRGTADHWTRVCTLTFTTGTQTSGTTGSEFCDTVVVSNETWLAAVNPLSPTGNYIAMVEMDVRGFDRIGFVPTTLATDTFIEITGL